MTNHPRSPRAGLAKRPKLTRTADSASRRTSPKKATGSRKPKSRCFCRICRRNWRVNRALKSRKPTFLRQTIEWLIDELIHAEFEAECKELTREIPSFRKSTKATETARGVGVSEEADTV